MFNFVEIMKRCQEWLANFFPKKRLKIKSPEAPIAKESSIIGKSHVFTRVMPDDTQYSKVCDRCNCTPEEFMGGDDEGAEVACYYHVIDLREPQPTVLWSDLDQTFVLFPEIEHPIEDTRSYLCLKCFDELFHYGEEEEEIDEEELEDE